MKNTIKNWMEWQKRHYEDIKKQNEDGWYSMLGKKNIPFQRPSL